MRGLSTSASMLLANIFMAFAATLAVAGAPSGQSIKLIVPAQTGGGTDVFARELAKTAGKLLDANVVVDNKDGGGGTLGITHLIAARPDGHTLALVWNGPLTATPHNLAVPYLPAHYRPLLSIGYSSYVLCTRADANVQDAQSFAAWLSAGNGKLTYGHDGSGGTMHLAAERIFLRLGISLRGVPFGGSAETAQALVGGRIDIYGGSISPILPLVAAGKVKCPLLTSVSGNPALPQAEGLGVLGLEAEETVLWWLLLAPAGTPEEVVKRLEEAFRAAAAAEPFLKLLSRSGAIARALDGKSTERLLLDEFAALAAISRTVANKKQ